jgi:hypothetical protein
MNFETSIPAPHTPRRETRRSSPLGSANGRWDPLNAVEVQLDSGTLQSLSDERVLAGANAALIADAQQVAARSARDRARDRRACGRRPVRNPRPARQLRPTFSGLDLFGPGQQEFAVSGRNPGHEMMQPHRDIGRAGAANTQNGRSSNQPCENVTTTTTSSALHPDLGVAETLTEYRRRRARHSRPEGLAASSYMRCRARLVEALAFQPSLALMTVPCSANDAGTEAPRVTAKRASLAQDTKIEVGALAPDAQMNAPPKLVND